MAIPSKIFIVGPRGAGKSIFAQLLAPALAERFGGSWPVAEMSGPLIEALATLFAFGGGEDRYKRAIADIEQKKSYHRPQLVALGDWIDRLAPGALLTHCAKTARIIVGARRRSEVNAYYGADAKFIAQEGVPWASHVWIYVERPGVGLEWDRFEREFFQTQICRHHITNTGDLNALKFKAAELAELLRGESGQ